MNIAATSAPIENIMWQQGEPPKRAGVYHVRLKDQVVYVGSSHDLRDRIRSHQVDPWYVLLTTQGITPQWYFHCVPQQSGRVDRDEARRLERLLIEMVRPTLNSIGSGNRKGKRCVQGAKFQSPRPHLSATPRVTITRDEAEMFVESLRETFNDK